MLCRIFAPVFLAVLLFPQIMTAQSPRQQGATSGRNLVTGPEAEAYAAADEYAAANNIPRAIGAFRGFLKMYPTSTLASRAQYRIAELYESQGNLSKAFDAYQTLVTQYPDTPEFEQAVAQQVLIANQFLNGRKASVFGLAILPGHERAQKMYEAILRNAPYSKHAPITQFNLGLAFQRQKKIAEARRAFQTVLDKYPDSDVADDALYQIAYIYMRTGLSGRSQDLSSLVLAKEMFEDFLLQYPNSEKAAQARDNLETIGNRESGDLMRIAKYYDWTRNYKAAAIYYNDIIRRQPKTADADIAKTRIEELRSEVGDDALRVGSERAETGERLALRRRLQAQVETSALADYAGPPKRDIMPDELPVARPRLRTNMRDVQPIPAVEPALPTE